MRPMDDTCVIEQVARDSYSRLLAYLVVQWRDVAGAEDALGEAFLSALTTWQCMGVPDKPEAWLLTVARRQMVDWSRRSRVHDKAIELLSRTEQMVQQDVNIGIEFPDERLKLMFMCAHPAIDTRIHAPLMLQIVMGLDAERIGSAFLIRPSTMGQRLSRAKAKIRDARIAFEIPDAHELPTRVASVLEAVYAAYGSGWEDFTPSGPHRQGLTKEAIYLGQLLSQLMPEDPEVHGLLALMLHCEARSAARRTATRQYVPLSEQNVKLWSLDLIQDAEHHLGLAARAGAIGRFQLEAAIQSAHAERLWTGRTQWEGIALLYEGLVHVAPTIGALVGRAAAVAEARGADKGLELLENIPTESVKNYQPFWALTAHLSKRMKRYEEASAAYSRAIGLCVDPFIREFLKHQACQDWQHVINSEDATS